MADGGQTTHKDQGGGEGRLDRLARRFGLETDPVIFFASAGLMVLFLAALLIWPDQIGETFADGRKWVVTNLGWFFVMGVTTWLVFLIWVAISKYGSLRLGGDQERPEFGNISWFTMLFAGGIGTVLMFWGVAEPVTHFGNPPRGHEPQSIAAAEDAMSIAIYHLGLHTWAIFTLPGLAFGYFIYRYDLPFRVSSVFYPFLKEKIYGPIGRTVDIFAVLGTLFGLAVSLGLGTNQVNAGLTDLFGVPDAVWPKVLIMGVLTATAVTSIVAGLDKGVRFLSNLNIGMAVALMIFVALVGPTVLLLREVVESAGLYLQNIVPLSLWNDSMANYTDSGGWGWQGDWTVFYWAWTVTWAPFMGVFLARISKGRTIREFIGGVMVAPSVFTLIWFVVFGWTGMDLDGIGAEADGNTPVIDAVNANVATAMFEFFNQLLANDGVVTLVSGLVVVIVALFFATSSDSASLVVDMLCAGTEEPGPVRQRVFWGVAEGSLATMLIVLAGDEGLTALQQVITVIGLPIFILMFLGMISLYKGLRTEKFVMVQVPVAGSRDPDKPTQEDTAVD